MIASIVFVSRAPTSAESWHTDIDSKNWFFTAIYFSYECMTCLKFCFNCYNMVKYSLSCFQISEKVNHHTPATWPGHCTLYLDTCISSKGVTREPPVKHGIAISIESSCFLTTSKVCFDNFTKLIIYTSKHLNHNNNEHIRLLQCN